MSAEIQASLGSSTLNPYFQVRNPAAQIWNTQTSAFESFQDSNWANYGVTMTQQGTSGYYVGDFPVGITTAGLYSISLYSRVGGSEAESDPLLASGQYQWSGSPTGNGSDWITLTDLKSYLEITDGSQDAKLSRLITQVSVMLTNDIQRNPVLSYYLETVNGQGFNFLKITNYPINSLTQVVQNYQGFSPQTFTGSSFVYNEEGQIRWAQSTGFGGFVPGFQNYQVSYQGGFTTVPQDLQLACMMVVQFVLNYSALNPTFQSMKIKDTQIAYRKAILLEDVQGILAFYRDPCLL